MALSADSLAGNKDKSAKDAKNKNAKNTKNTVTKDDTERAEVVSTLENNEEIGRLSSSVALVNLLGDPSDIDTAKVKTGEGDETKVSKISRTVGYRIKNVGEEPVTWYEYGLTENFSHSDRLNHNEDFTEKTLAPGETADITIYEAAVLIATPEFNGKFSAGDNPITAHFAKQSNSEGVETTNENSTRVRFMIDNPGMTIRDVPNEDVLDSELDENGRSKKRTIRPGYEKFAPVANRTRKQSTRSSSGSSKPTNRRNKNAAQFLAGTALAAKK